MEINKENLKECGHMIVVGSVAYSTLHTLVEGRKYRCQCCHQIVEGERYVKAFEQKLKLINSKLQTR